MDTGSAIVPPNSTIRGTLSEMQRQFRRKYLRVVVCFIVLFLAVLPANAWAWNIPGHMLSGAISYQILRSESPATIATVKSILQKHPWYETQWKEQLDKLPESQRVEMLFMLAARWADDIRTKDKAQHRGPWHYIDFPFKPAGQPDAVQTKPPQAVNILTALAENERLAKMATDPAQKAIALTWLFHLVGDIHQPLHTVQLFTVNYPNGDRGGNLICVRTSDTAKAMDLVRFWNRVITSSSNATRLINEATRLRNRPDFSRSRLTELASENFKSWADESLQIAMKFTYQNGNIPGSPKGSQKTCGEVGDAAILATGYVRMARAIADRRIILTSYRLADLLRRF